jgi:hypothetical protein
MNYLAGLAWNGNPPELCLLSSQNYRCELPTPSSTAFSKKVSLRNRRKSIEGVWK